MMRPLIQVNDEVRPMTDAEYQSWKESFLNKDLTDISPRQIRMALTRSGLRETVEAAVKAGSQDLKDWWEFSTVFERNHPQVLAMAQALNVENALLDELWILGSEL